MPYSQHWIEPEQFLEHKGVRVFHSYEDDDIEQGPRKYSFILDPLGSDYDDSFDVRELKNWQEPPRPPYLSEPGADTPANRAAWDHFLNEAEPNAIRQAIIAAIELGILTKPELVIYRDQTRYCDNPLCEATAVHTVEVSINSSSDETRHYCECCFQAYLVDVQHGTYRKAFDGG